MAENPSLHLFSTSYYTGGVGGGIAEGGNGDLNFFFTSSNSKTSWRGLAMRQC